MKARGKYTWIHAAALGIVANIASAVPAGYNGDETYYERLRTPPGSPPGWLFAPAWAVNNVLTLWSNLRIANTAPSTPGRREALVSEGVSWVLFAAFSGLYFGLRSPVLGAVDTVAGLATTIHGVRATGRIDRAAGWALVPRLIWLAYASYVSVGTAAKSKDDVFDRLSKRK
ncbi:TspO/MBR family protein [Marisediminicola senii]|uniref:TspO/MBR family protein n=1 Tax=Marisediminicola senii TaxID=2711233 RepID=UPI0013EAE2B7|nr:TspO/MBR family protein [Marisediminicola senii]